MDFASEYPSFVTKQLQNVPDYYDMGVCLDACLDHNMRMKHGHRACKMKPVHFVLQNMDEAHQLSNDCACKHHVHSEHRVQTKRLHRLRRGTGATACDSMLEMNQLKEALDGATIYKEFCE